MGRIQTGDRVRVLKFGVRMSGRIGSVRDQYKDGKLPVSFDDGDCVSFPPMDLEKIPSFLGRLD
jgi:hypothetical protein